jgi:hypothetical protein
MIKEDKYYYICPIPSLISSKRQAQVSRYNIDFIVEVNENVDYKQDISLTINKLKQKDITKPTSTQFEKVKPVISLNN